MTEKEQAIIDYYDKLAQNFNFNDFLSFPKFPEDLNDFCDVLKGFNLQYIKLLDQSFKEFETMAKMNYYIRTVQWKYRDKDEKYHFSFQPYSSKIVKVPRKKLFGIIPRSDITTNIDITYGYNIPILIMCIIWKKQGQSDTTLQFRCSRYDSLIRQFAPEIDLNWVYDELKDYRTSIDDPPKHWLE